MQTHTTNTNTLWDFINATIDEIPDAEQINFLNQLIDDLSQMRDGIDMAAIAKRCNPDYTQTTNNRRALSILR
jgi:hypothetical protein